jgi:hypothetical protein
LCPEKRAKMIHNSLQKSRLWQPNSLPAAFLFFVLLLLASCSPAPAPHRVTFAFPAGGYSSIEDIQFFLRQLEQDPMQMIQDGHLDGELQPTLAIKIDREKAAFLGFSFSEVHTEIQANVQRLNLINLGADSLQDQIGIAKLKDCTLKSSYSGKIARLGDITEIELLQQIGPITIVGQKCMAISGSTTSAESEIRSHFRDFPRREFLPQGLDYFIVFE